ncbi:cysteine-rich receptor-like protein kinase 43 isoform X2 [Magnolia sinica]|uniref:cysteine-rich receptor-like protein kinase 43 isoform X2 n=1 Tax=Magnolia sinica TaxID=86752 RepID=UPI00265A187C|nr:cysteine-rich receptor-like protein kinase 43 isoform X2 [Magnolia sinica]
MQFKTPTHSFSLITLLLFFSNPTSSDPQTNLLTKDCNLFDAPDSPSVRLISANLNATLSDLRSQLSSSHFATAQRPGIYALFQCRDYLSASDCLSCFSSAASEMQRNCPSASSSRVIYDGCFLRYEGEAFFDQATQPGNAGFCGNRTVLDGIDFNRTAHMLLTDLCTATPRSRGFFVAAKREGVGVGDVVYGVAQCALTVSESGCGECLTVAYGNIESCPPNADGRAVDVGCFLRYSDTAFFSDNQTTDLAALLRRKGGLGRRKKDIIAIVAALLLSGMLVLIVLLLLRRFKKNKMSLQEILGATELRGTVNFNYQELKSATRNFSEENKVGGGGFGDVYMGVMRDGKTVAVKKLAITQSEQTKGDFEKEVKLMSNVHHRNLVRLLGCCSKGTEYLLVYEYAANNNLAKFLFGERRGTLCWKQRFDIIIGTARGLAYLHEEFHVCIIHRDIKSNNILLDEEFQPKIADFGLARLLPANNHQLVTRFAGTLGYMAPEYAIRGQVSEKVDVYSYGMVVLEIISGRKSSDIKHEPVTEYLIEWAWRLYEEDSLMELVDESLNPDEYETNEVKKVIEIALMCTQAATTRPAMSQVVVLLLNKDDDLGHTLTRPNFINVANTIQNTIPQRDTSTLAGSPSSNATMSVSQFSPR